MDVITDWWTRRNFLGKLSIVGGSILGIGILSWILIGDVGVTILNVTVSGLLTAALALLYSQQAEILKSQRDLQTDELNREIRMHHTETLRERVREWHGEPDKTVEDVMFDGPSLNIPSVGATDIESAPNSESAFPRGEVFTVVPHSIKNDRYLEDLLENHAPELADKKEEIEQNQIEFKKQRENFINEFRDSHLETDQGGSTVRINHEIYGSQRYTLYPNYQLAEVVFEVLVILHRGIFEEMNEALDNINKNVEEGKLAKVADQDAFMKSYSENDDNRPIFRLQCQNPPLIDPSECDSLISEEVSQVVIDLIKQTNSPQPPEPIMEAAKVLDDSREAVQELERILIEYEGRPIYPGDCKYLEEARIQPDESDRQ